MRKSLQILLNPEMKALERAAVPQRGIWAGHSLCTIGEEMSIFPEIHLMGSLMTLDFTWAWFSCSILTQPMTQITHPPVGHSYPVMLWNSPPSICFLRPFSECSWWLHLQCGGNKTQERLGWGHGDSSIRAWGYRSLSTKSWKVLEHRGRMSESNLNYRI